jgi:hypothetical protein
MDHQALMKVWLKHTLRLATAMAFLTLPWRGRVDRIGPRSDEVGVG